MLWPVGSCVAVTRGTSRLLVCWSSCRKEGWCSPQSSCCGEESLASVMAQVRRACMSRGWRTLRPRRRGPRALRPGELPTRRAALTRNPTRPALRRRQNPSERAPAARPDAVWLQQRLGECQATDEGVQRARGGVQTNRQTSRDLQRVISQPSPPAASGARGSALAGST